MPYADLHERLSIAREHPAVEAAILGLVDEPSPRLSNIWALYERHNAGGLTGMSRDQLRKHRTSRERAIRYAIEELGDMELAIIRRKDVLRLRDWWTTKIAKEGLTAYSANRCFSDIMGMLSVTDNALHSDFHLPWEKTHQGNERDQAEQAPPFPISWIRQKILAPGALDAMNEDARYIVYAMVETGLRLGEVCNLRPQDIRLEDDVPHVEVADRDDRRQKTEYSIRRIPLVGVSLWAMNRRPQGFKRYQDKADHASALINKVMRGASLMPSADHTIYSMRHSFQDRIENVGCSDRMQADLMGHEFGRPTYGDGADMMRRKKLLEVNHVRLAPSGRCIISAV
ncbi:site-specific integrase [Sinorhizobium sp. BJ1]|uniref:site-specific integrase n=1 Tax=Sinorhizobium sp. BJ1 TaxID=2035455 RepID=UPI001FDF737E|nr:site-specific integrase [Sinorhizobium sp. BJ1]